MRVSGGPYVGQDPWIRAMWWPFFLLFSLSGLRGWRGDGGAAVIMCGVVHSDFEGQINKEPSSVQLIEPNDSSHPSLLARTG